MPQRFRVEGEEPLIVPDGEVRNGGNRRRCPATLTLVVQRLTIKDTRRDEAGGDTIRIFVFGPELPGVAERASARYHCDASSSAGGLPRPGLPFGYTVRQPLLRICL